MSVWRSGRWVEVKGDMIEYIHNICNSGYPAHVNVTLMYVSTANLLNIQFISRVERNVILKSFLTTLISMLNIHLGII